MEKVYRIEQAYADIPKEIEDIMRKYGVGAKDLYFIMKKFARNNDELKSSGYWKNFREFKL